MGMRWHAFSGILQQDISKTVVEILYEVYFWGDLRAVFNALSDAEDYLIALGVQISPNPGIGWYIRQRSREQDAQSKGNAIVPLSPLPVWDKPGKVLATRGFWDVQSLTVPGGIVSNFAFGMVFLPVKSVYDRHPDPQAPFVEQYELREDADVPDPLVDDPGWFCYDSFVRVSTDVNQDPPFYSKSLRKFPAHSCLCCVAGVEVVVQALQRLRLNLGIRFRVLVET